MLVVIIIVELARGMDDMKNVTFLAFRRMFWKGSWISALVLTTSTCLETFCFSAPPPSPDCIVVGYRKRHTLWDGYIHYVARQPTRWREIPMNYGCFDQESLRNSIFHGGCVCLSPKKLLRIFTTSPQEFLVERDQNLLLVIVGEFGESIEVFKLDDYTKQWVKIDGLGRHMIYICGKTCLCIEAKTREMENKIYFPRLRSGNGKIVFYSLETHRYHTFNDRNIEESFGDFFGTKHHLNPHAWIEPSWL
uniref:KIB1-4 beta-propeller domain-containing protein n=1 Tax=Tanacetum cinerariifolium TaxID=118510 RepID=A0A6L2KER9_TANCI|nr:hypothetical protein [Tanacetum cinerariifolium]